jgi:5-carboxymethyl-2-hydroxymuconate isomerase
MPQFKIEQIALSCDSSVRARSFLSDLGLSEWHHDTVVARGSVFNETDCRNTAHLAFNYQAGNGADDKAGKPLELEILDYVDGENWMDVSRDANETGYFGAVSHLGMHVSEEELTGFDLVMQKHGINIAQRVVTQSHTNPAIKDTRRYKYVIYDTRFLIGVDLKFIVRLPYSTPQ